MPSIESRRAPGTALAVLSPPEWGTRGSAVPWMPRIDCFRSGAHVDGTVADTVARDLSVLAEEHEYRQNDRFERDAHGQEAERKRVEAPDPAPSERTHVQDDPHEEDAEMDEAEGQTPAELGDPVGDLHDGRPVVFGLLVDVARDAVPEKPGRFAEPLPHRGEQRHRRLRAEPQELREVAAVDDQGLDIPAGAATGTMAAPAKLVPASTSVISAATSSCHSCSVSGWPHGEIFCGTSVGANLPNGTQEIFGIGLNYAVWTDWGTEARPSGWKQLSGPQPSICDPSNGRLVLGNDGDYGLIVGCTDFSGTTWSNSRGDGPNGTWSGWII